MGRLRISHICQQVMASSAARVGLALTAVVVALGTGSAFASQPEPWQIGFQDSATPMKAQIRWLHDFILVIITLISVFVLGLLIWVSIRYNSKANPVPSKVSHNTTLEAVWTIIPSVIVSVIAFFSFGLLYYVETVPEPDLTIKATGYQWYWGYEYPDNGGFEFFSNMLSEEDAANGTDAFGDPHVYRLSVDNDIVVPVGKTVAVTVTAADVLHNFAMPSFGLKTDAVPGRLNQTWFRVDEPGMYYGQCSEICGPLHAFMPIAIRAVPEAEFEAWAAERRAEFAGVTDTSEVDDRVAELR